MNKAVKVILNVSGAAGCAVLGYFIGKKHGEKIAEAKLQWAIDQANQILNDEVNKEEVVEEKPVEVPIPADILEKLETNDEVVVEEPIPEPKEQTKKPAKKTSKRAPMFVSSAEFDEKAYDSNYYNLTLDHAGDLYIDDSEELFVDRAEIGEKNINMMLKDAKNKDAGEWWIYNESSDTWYDIVFGS